MIIKGLPLKDKTLIFLPLPQPKSQLPLSATSFVISMRKHLFASLDSNALPQTSIKGTKPIDKNALNDGISEVDS